MNIWLNDSFSPYFIKLIQIEASSLTPSIHPFERYILRMIPKASDLSYHSTQTIVVKTTSKFLVQRLHEFVKLSGSILFDPFL